MSSKPSTEYTTRPGTGLLYILNEPEDISASKESPIDAIAETV